MKFKGKIAAWFWIIFLAGNVLMAYELVESSGVSAEIGAALWNSTRFLFLWL